MGLIARMGLLCWVYYLQCKREKERREKKREREREGTEQGNTARSSAKLR